MFVVKTVVSLNVKAISFFFSIEYNFNIGKVLLQTHEIQPHSTVFFGSDK